MPRLKKHIPGITSGKVQLKPIDHVLRLDLPLLRDVSEESLLRLIRDNRDFGQWVRENFPRGELGRVGVGTGSQSRTSLTPSNLRAVIFGLFSLNQRAGGSRISGFPLIEVDSTACVGVQVDYSAEREAELSSDAGSDTGSKADSIRLSGYHIKVGSPYAKRIKRATSLIANSIDRVAANISSDATGPVWKQKSISVEGLTTWCIDNLQKLMARPNAQGRFISKVDFVLYPPASLRESVLKRGSMNERQAKELRAALDDGQFCLSVLDISGGGAGVGISDAVASHWGLDSSGTLETYMGCLLTEYHRRNDRAPNQIVIMPDETDLRSFYSVEYLPLLDGFRKRGFACYIVTSEAYQGQLEGTSRPLRVRSVEGATVTISNDEKTLIVRRYPYLYEGLDHPQATIPRHPIGTTVLPSDESRIAASDCRVKLRILEHATRSLRGSGSRARGAGLQVIPFAFVKLEDPNAAYAAQGFLASCLDQWPEVNHLGGVVKPVDKVPDSAAGVVRSAYPLPPIPTTSRVMDILVKPLFESLLSKGVKEVVVMPNVLPLVVDQDHRLLPKFEIRMIWLDG